MHLYSGVSELELGVDYEKCVLCEYDTFRSCVQVGFLRVHCQWYEFL